MYAVVYNKRYPDDMPMWVGLLETLVSIEDFECLVNTLERCVLHAPSIEPSRMIHLLILQILHVVGSSLSRPLPPECSTLKP